MGRSWAWILLLALAGCGKGRRDERSPGPIVHPEAAARENEPGAGCLLADPEKLKLIPKAASPFSGDALPTAVDLSADLPPPGDQGRQNSCVGWSVAYALKSYHEKIEEKQPLVQGGRVDPRRVFSPAYVYNQINNGRDGGSFFADALDILKKQGGAPLALAPYNDQDYRSTPSAEARAAAARYRVESWKQVGTEDVRELKAQLNAGIPVMIAARVDEGFQKARRGHVWKASEGKPLGGHAMVLVGYDDARNAFKLINSWGAAWGDEGYGWIDYGWFPKVVAEAYVAKDAYNGGAPADPTAPPPSLAAELTLTNVLHNAQIPGDPRREYFMRFDGTLSLPARSGRVNQVVIWFFWAGPNGTKGAPVKSLNAQYATAFGDAACGTAKYPVPEQGLKTTWAAWIPYSALHLWAGQWQNTPAGQVYQPYVNNLVAEPVLFVDNFGVKSAPLVPFGARR